jgi:hypothetical protein
VIVPIISRYACNECDFELPTGWGGYTYAVDDVGKRIVCPHPAEFRSIQEVTGLGYSEARDAGRTGFAQHCVCLDCVSQFDLDLERDAAVCSKCSSPKIKSLRELVGKPCPRCKVGLIEEGSPIRWKLDPDWEKLPVPQIVKDLADFHETRIVPASLQPASDAANAFSAHNFFIVASRLLGWWEGEYFSKEKDQKDSAEMQPQWTWCKALPAVLKEVPSLAELVVIRDRRCWFAETVTTDVRRGIKNYLRKHLKHRVIS